jgi:hypothetical protein
MVLPQMEVNHWHPELEISSRDIVEVRCLLLLYQLSEVGDIFSLGDLDGENPRLEFTMN